MTENQGRWNCPTSVYYATSLPVTTTMIVSESEADNTQINLSCLVPNILPRLPVDPSFPANSTTTGYTLRYETSSGRITVCAPSAELNETICTVR